MHSGLPSTASPSFRRAPSPAASASPLKTRLGLFAFGAILALSGCWLLLPELIQPKTIGLPQDAAGAAAANAHKSEALLAAQIGAIRGDLWAAAAFADSSLLWLDRAALLDRANSGRIARARSNAESALALAPINGEAWLFLAALPSDAPGGAESNVAALLQMSYFTAPNDLTLAELRLARVATSSALADKDIQEFIKNDIRRILAYRPHLKSAIIAAYRNAWPQNRPLLESLAADVDPAFAQSLRSASQK
jgi:hypothetical protein